jgi:hypothetical protein
MNRSELGAQTEAIILGMLAQEGFTVLIPFGHHARYDLVIDTVKGFQRIQCKTGRLRNGVLLFSTTSTTLRTGGKYTRTGYLGDADVFAVYCAELKSTYIIPVDEVSTSSGYIRMYPGKIDREGPKITERYHLSQWSKGMISPRQGEDTGSIPVCDTAKTGTCAICGERTSSKKYTRCAICAHKKQERIIWPEYDILKKMVTEEPYTTVAKRLGVSDNAIRKRLSSHEAHAKIQS